MSVPENLIDFDVIEGQKENIQSLPGGRSARTLATLFTASPLQPLATPIPADSKNLNDAIRTEYEAELLTIAEADDPLDIYDRYVKWTLDAYPSAQATAQSQLLPLLERATKSFLNSAQYQNDPRYLKLWLLYIRLFADTPRETFAFLSRHNIGNGLASFYEEFASWLEGAGRWSQADEVYNLGIQREAMPAARLLRKYTEFQQRYAQEPEASHAPSSPALPTVRPALAAKLDPFATSSPIDPQAARSNSGVGGTSSKSSKSKLTIFSDADAAAPAVSGAEGTKGWQNIGSLADRKKENVVEARPWVGETLKAGGKKSSVPKMAIFKDQSIPIQSISQSIVPSKEQVTMNPRSGRKERIFVNLEAVYPIIDSCETEMSFEELRASSRGWLQKSWTPRPLKPEEEAAPMINTAEIDERAVFEEISFNKGFEEKLVIPLDQPILDENGEIKESAREPRMRRIKTMEVNETQIIKTKLSSPSGKKLKRKPPAEPTMTFHTRAATDDIYELFNQPLKPSGELEEDEQSDQDDGDETDGDYTSGGESTGTGRLITASEAGDDETFDVKSVSEWSDFTTRKHVPNLEGEGHDHDDAEDEDGIEESQSSQSTRQTELTEEPSSEALPNEDEELVTPISPELSGARTTFVPIPPEDYVALTRPFRDPSQASQNRLPFMTPIAEKTESSLGAQTCRTEKDYFNSKTPSKANGPPMSSFHKTDDLMSSPFQDDAALAQPKGKIAPPALGRSVKASKPLGGTTANVLRDIAAKGPIIQDVQCNPVDEITRSMIFEKLQPPLNSYDGFYDHSGEVCGRSAELKKFAKAVTKMSKSNSEKTSTNISMPPVLEFPGIERKYMVKRELGAGAFAPVYLLENVDEGSAEDVDGQPVVAMGKGQFDALARRNLEALKMEDPPSAWEFYIMSQAMRRLGVSRAADSVVNVYEMHLYQDECYLIEEFRDQGTLLDVVNIARADSTTAGGLMEEILVMFFSIELLRPVEVLHSKGILHGDLKADNCLVRLDQIDEWSSRYKRDGTGGWNKKGLALIDFGRGIDMKVFRPDVQFIADWKTTPQDCAEMRELRPWTYQIDYHGLAGIIHSMLFGKYIDTVADQSTKVGAGATKRYRLKESLKRYWQQDIWTNVFDLLLNPTMHLEGEEGAKLPISKGLRAVREQMEEWVELNCERGVGLQAGLRRLENTLQARRR